MSICLAVIRDHVDVMYEVLLKSQLLHLILKQQTLFTLQVNCKHALVLHKGFCFFMFFNIKKQKPLSQSISVIYLQKKILKTSSKFTNLPMSTLAQANTLEHLP